jgi:hypothetical protein
MVRCSSIADSKANICVVTESQNNVVTILHRVANYRNFSSVISVLGSLRIPPRLSVELWRAHIIYTTAYRSIEQ